MFDQMNELKIEFSYVKFMQIGKLNIVIFFLQISINYH